MKFPLHFHLNLKSLSNLQASDKHNTQLWIISWSSLYSIITPSEFNNLIGIISDYYSFNWLRVPSLIFLLTCPSLLLWVSLYSTTATKKSNIYFKSEEAFIVITNWFSITHTRMYVCLIRSNFSHLAYYQCRLPHVGSSPVCISATRKQMCIHSEKNLFLFLPVRPRAPKMDQLYSSKSETCL